LELIGNEREDRARLGGAEMCQNEGRDLRMLALEETRERLRRDAVEDGRERARAVAELLELREDLGAPAVAALVVERTGDDGAGELLAVDRERAAGGETLLELAPHLVDLRGLD